MAIEHVNDLFLNIVNFFSKNANFAQNKINGAT
jgi:hypothetical protein